MNSMIDNTTANTNDTSKLRKKYDDSWEVDDSPVESRIRWELHQVPGRMFLEGLKSIS